MNISTIFKSKAFMIFLYGLGIVIMALVIFQAGIFVGYRKAAFSYRWGDNYYQMFGGPRDRFMRGMPNDDFPNAHGTVGAVIKIDLPTIVIEGRDKLEKVIVINDRTIIRRFRETIQSQDLHIGDFVVAIGAPDNTSRIQAQLLRVIPPPPDFRGQQPVASSTAPAQL